MKGLKHISNRKGEDMKALPLIGLVLALAASLAAAPGESSWRMKADYVEACSCHLFCQCYFSDSHGHKHAEHPFCEFNMAVTVREGHSGNVDLANTKYWLTGDLGDKWGTENKATWVTVSFDPKTTQAQRDALAPIILKTYGLEGPRLQGPGPAFFFFWVAFPRVALPRQMCLSHEIRLSIPSPLGLGTPHLTAL